MNGPADDWVKVIVHEMRNPLAAVGAGLRLLTRHDANSHFAIEVRERMEIQLRQLSRLVDDLGDSQQLAIQRFAMRSELIDLSLVLERAIEMIRPLIEHFGHELRARLSRAPLILHGDADRLTQVFVNLLENAAYYTEPGGRIMISSELVSSRIVVRVQDNGPGISEDLLLHVFDMHTRGPEQVRNRPQGTGIGLAIVRNIVEAHGGSVTATSSREDRGSSFLVELPTGGKETEG